MSNGRRGCGGNPPRRGLNAAQSEMANAGLTGPEPSLRDQIGGWQNHSFVDVRRIAGLPLPGVEDLKRFESCLRKTPREEENFTAILTNPRVLTMDEAAAAAMNGLFPSTIARVLNLNQFKTFQHTFNVVVEVIKEAFPVATMDAIDASIQNWFQVAAQVEV